MDIVPFTLSAVEDRPNRVYAACMWVQSDNDDSAVVVFRRGPNGQHLLGVSETPESALSLYSRIMPLRIEWCDEEN